MQSSINSYWQQTACLLKCNFKCIWNLWIFISRWYYEGCTHTCTLLHYKWSSMHKYMMLVLFQVICYTCFDANIIDIHHYGCCLRLKKTCNSSVDLKVALKIMSECRVWINGDPGSCWFWPMPKWHSGAFLLEYRFYDIGFFEAWHWAMACQHTQSVAHSSDSFGWSCTSSG